MNIRRSAFTIVELLIVIIVIAVLATLSIISYSAVTNKAGIATIQSDLSNNAKKLKLYYAQNGSYPTSLDANGCPSAPTATTDPTYCLKYSSGITQASYTGTASTFSLSAQKGSLNYLVTQSTSPTANISPVSGGSLASDATYYYNVFTTSGTFALSTGTLTADILVVAGGGGGGSGGGGGGNCGSFTASNGGSGTAGQGNAGGNTATSGSWSWGTGGGGGGGAGAAGTAITISGTTNIGGNGGAGTGAYSTWLTSISSVMSSVSGWSTATANGKIAGGGGGRGSGNTAGIGGDGGGGRGVGTDGSSVAGVANTGGGGGSESAGGSGIIIVRYTRAQVGG